MNTEQNESAIMDQLKLDYEHMRLLPDGRIAGIRALMYTWGLFVGLDKTGYQGRYCYSARYDAIDALK